MGQYGLETVRKMLALQKADFAGKGVDGDTAVFSQVEALLEETLLEEACFTIKDLAVNGQDLINLGFAPGPAIGACLASLLEQVQDEILPNEKQTLLRAANRML